jgi:uncharacterized protein (TIGR01319 family)
MKIDVLVAEIGSTTTVVNGFNNMGTDAPVFIGQGHAPTSVVEGDVRIGLKGAIDDLCKNQGVSEITYDNMLAASSAAGGLRMTVHGLVYDMPVKAGREAALGAGANIHMTTAGNLRDIDIEELEEIEPNLILLAGGTDYGDRDTALNNAKILCESKTKAPVIYCGNVENQRAIRRIFEKAGRQLYITENVYPKLDQLNIEPVRDLIHKAFEEHITEAPGMKYIRELVTGTIMPTPGAVMECAKMLYQEIGDVAVVDVGGATTDIHSVTDGSEEIALIQISPEPQAKRTVEGDLGVYVNAQNLSKMIGFDKLEKETGVNLADVLKAYQPIPNTNEQVALTTSLTWHASSMALKRHAGYFHYTYGSTGRKTWAEGKDMTQVRWLVATGGALTRLPNRGEILERLTKLNESGKMLYPRPGQMKVLEDKHYIMAALGVLCMNYPKEAAILVKCDLGYS